MGYLYPVHPVGNEKMVVIGGVLLFYVPEKTIIEFRKLVSCSL